MEIDINCLLVFSLLGSWLFITWGKGASEKLSLVLGGHFGTEGSLPGGGGGANLINLMKLVQSSNN